MKTKKFNFSKYTNFITKSLASLGILYGLNASPNELTDAQKHVLDLVNHDNHITHEVIDENLVFKVVSESNNPNSLQDPREIELGNRTASNILGKLSNYSTGENILDIAKASLSAVGSNNFNPDSIKIKPNYSIKYTGGDLVAGSLDTTNVFLVLNKDNQNDPEPNTRVIIPNEICDDIYNARDSISTQEVDSLVVNDTTAVDTLWSPSEAIDFYNIYLKELKEEKKISDEFVSIYNKYIVKGIGDRETLTDDNQRRINKGFSKLEEILSDRDSLYAPSVEVIESVKDSLGNIKDSQQELIDREISFGLEVMGNNSLDLSNYGDIISRINSINLNINEQKPEIKIIERGIGELRKENKEVKELINGLKNTNKDYQKTFDKDTTFFSGPLSEFYDLLGNIKDTYSSRLNTLNEWSTKYKGGLHENELNDVIESESNLIKSIDEILNPKVEEKREVNLPNPFKNSKYKGIGVAPYITTNGNGDIQYGLGLRSDFDNFALGFEFDFGSKAYESKDVFLSDADNFGIQSRITKKLDNYSNLGTASLTFNKSFSDFEVGVGPLVNIKEGTITKYTQEETLRNGEVVSTGLGYSNSKSFNKIDGGVGFRFGYNISDNFGVGCGINVTKKSSPRYQVGLRFGK